MSTIIDFNPKIYKEKTEVAATKQTLSQSRKSTPIPVNAYDEPDYGTIKDRALDKMEGIIDWLDLEGELAGKEFKFFNPKRDDYELGSCSVNMETGYWADFAIDDAKGDLINLVAYIKDVKPHEAARLLWDFLEASDGDPVQALNSTGKRFTKKKKAEDNSTLVMPVPDNAPIVPSEYWPHGAPTATYRYLDAEGLLLFLVLRFDNRKEPGKKIFNPLTLRRNAQSQLYWDRIAPTEPRPLYGLNHLAAKPLAPVMIVEGEKSADAASLLFPDHAVVTTMNGAKSPDKSDFTPLLGRQAFIWPDHDEPGQRYAETIVSILRNLDPSASIAVMQPLTVSPGTGEDGEPRIELGFESPKGWDAADAVAMGWTAGHIELLSSDYFQAVPQGAMEVSTLNDNSIQVVAGQETMPPKVIQFLKRCFPNGLIYTNETFLGYEHGYWRRLDERSEVNRKIGNFFGKELEKAKDINNLLELLKNLLAQRDIDVAPNKNLICLQNGTLDTTTYQLIQHNPSHWLQTKIDIAWNPAETCPRWLQFLDEIFINDIDKAQKIAFMQEWFGYCLTPDASQHKFVWMVGAGGNGKSVLLAILTFLVGRDNVSHAYMERLDKGCVRAELEGKLVNISSEMSAEATVADGYFKAIVSGDIVEAERKFKPPFSFKPYVRLIGATNHLPRLLDLSDGFFRRAIVLNFNRQFDTSEQDSGLEEKLVAELPGILVWAMEGLKHLRARGKFDIPPSSVAALTQYKEESDPIGMFADECLERNDIRGMKSSEIYDGYRKWCTANGFSPKNNVGFGKRLGELGFVKYRSASGGCWKVNTKESNCHVWGAAEVLDDFIPTVIEPASSMTKYKL